MPCVEFPLIVSVIASIGDHQERSRRDEVDDRYRRIARRSIWDSLRFTSLIAPNEVPLEFAEQQIKFPGNPAVHFRALRHDRADTSVHGRYLQYDPTTQAGTPDPDTRCIHLWTPRKIRDGISEVIDVVSGIHHSPGRTLAL